ncbi:NLRC3, partial [Symbiodinium sp. KB8]
LKRPLGSSKAGQGKEYDLADKSKLADFLEDADIQLGGPGTRRISKDALRVIVRNLKGDRFTVDMLQDILQEVVPDREGLLSCEDLARCLRRPDPVPQPQKAGGKWPTQESAKLLLRWEDIQADHLDAATDPIQEIVDHALDPDSIIPGRIFQQHPTQGVAKANISKWLKNVKSKSKRYNLAQKQGLADFLKDADIRLVRADFILKLHREGQHLPRRQEAESAYVDGRTALVTHEEVQVWAHGKAREHCDPYGYQVSKLAKALTGKEWVFIDYVSLYQFQRLSQQQNLSFRRAMQHMHVLYCHDKTSTLRIESLTPEADIAKAERNQDSVILYDHPTGGRAGCEKLEQSSFDSVVSGWRHINTNTNTPYGERGWCAAEREWSSTRAATNLSREIDAPEGEKGGIAPMLPEAFRKDVAGRLKFTHLDDVETVCRLQAEVYKEKAKMCKSLRLVDLGAEALGTALSALERYPVLESLEIVHCELGPKLPLLLKALEKIKLRQLHLQQNELFEEGTRQVIEALALQSNRTLVALSLGHDGIGVANVKALAEALRTNRALIELNLGHACLSIDGIIALAEAIKQNRTLKQLSLAGSKVGEEGAFALLEALRTSGVERRLDLTGCGWGDWGDLGKAQVALARALRTGQVQVKGTVTHPALEFSCMLEARVLSLKRGKFFITSGKEAPFRRLFAPLCRALPELPKLRVLYLGLGADQARALAAGLGQQKELERLELNLNGNSLGEEGAKAVASALARLTELKELSLGLVKNQIGDAGAAAVAESLRNLRQLTKLSVGLSGNALGAAGATAVVESLRELPQLTEVVVGLRDNELGEEEKEKFRATFDALPVREKGLGL